MAYACFLLPFPPSTNNLFVNNPKTRGRFPAPGYREWQKEAARHLTDQGLLQRFDHSVHVILSFGRPDRRRRDLGNLEKAVTDFCVSAGILEDDSLIDRLVLQWSGDVVGCRVEIMDAAEVYGTTPPRNISTVYG